MYLRRLVDSDAPLMLEWMSDPDITRYFRADFASMTLTDVSAFIESSQKISHGNINAAVSSDNGAYMGTVSLKHIDFHGGSAEFAIVMRKCAMGKGYAWFGMSEIIAGAFRDLNLSLVYWNVLRNNLRAVRFYDKHNFSEMLNVPGEFMKYYEGVENLKWYSVNQLMTNSDSPSIIDTRHKTQDTRHKTQDTSSYYVFIRVLIDYTHILITRKFIPCSLFYGRGYFCLCFQEGVFNHEKFFSQR